MAKEGSKAGAVSPEPRGVSDRGGVSDGGYLLLQESQGRRFTSTAVGNLKSS